MNVLLDDLKLAAGHVITHALNELPERTRAAVASALQDGGRLEVRVRPSSPEHYSVWMVGATNRADLRIMSLDEPLDS